MKVPRHVLSEANRAGLAAYLPLRIEARPDVDEDNFEAMLAAQRAGFKVFRSYGYSPTAWSNPNL